MRSYLELITYWEAFLKIYPKGTMKEFAFWLAGEVADQVEDPAAIYHAKKPSVAEQQVVQDDHLPNIRVAYLLWRLNKILRVYKKPIFDTEGLKSQDEFAILSHIYKVGECTKKEAVETHFIDRSTGIDMIKRLVRRGMLTDRVCPQDRRARLIQLSSDGEALLHRIYSRLVDIPEMLINMTHLEKEAFLQQLEEMNKVHTHNLNNTLTNSKDKSN